MLPYPVDPFGSFLSEISGIKTTAEESYKFHVGSQAIAGQGRTGCQTSDFENGRMSAEHRDTEISQVIGPTYSLFHGSGCSGTAFAKCEWSCIHEPRIKLVYT